MAKKKTSQEADFQYMYDKHALKKPVEFKLDEKDKESKPKYIYDYSKLNARQIQKGKFWFKLEEEYYKKLPESPDDIKMVTHQNIQEKAFASIVNMPIWNSDENGKVTQNGFKKYDPLDPPAINFLDDVYGEEGIRKLEEIKLDFFCRTPSLREELQKKELDHLTLLSKILTPEMIEMTKQGLQNPNGLETLLKNSTQQVESQTKK